jgi:integrase
MEQAASKPKKDRRTRAATVAEVNAMRKAGRHSVGDGLILAVSESGARSWMARVRDPVGKRRDYGLGPYPEVTLAEARERAAKMRRDVRDGITPPTKKERRAAARRIPTFEQAARLLFESEKESWRNEKHRYQWIRTLEMFVFPKVGALPVDQVGRPQVIDALTPIWKAKPETARRVLQRVLTVVDWAFARDYRTTQVPRDAVIAGLGDQPGERGNFAAIPYSQAPALLSTFRDQPETFGRLGLQFAILTAARSGEVRGALWSEIDREARTWTVPAERMKAKKEHVVPLNDSALTLIDRAAEIRTGDLIFPGAGGRKPMSDATMAKALREAGVPREKGTVHGMRSTFRDWAAEETTVQNEVVEMALAHAISSAVERAYRRGDLLAKRRGLMDAWDRYLSGQTAAVVQMVAA